MRVPGPFPAHLQDAPFTRAQALAAGVSGSRLRSRDVERVAHGHYRWIGPVTGATPPARPLATELSRLQDLAAMSLRGVAQEAGVGVGTLYRHFPTRRDLLDAVL